MTFGTQIICTRTPWFNVLLMHVPHKFFHAGYGPNLNEVVTVGSSENCPKGYIEILEYRHCPCGKIVCFESKHFTELVEDKVLYNELKLIR